MLVVDMENCSHVVSRRIVLRSVIGLEAKAKDDPIAKKRGLQVKLNDADVRSFKVLETVDEQTVLSCIDSNKLLQSLIKL